MNKDWNYALMWDTMRRTLEELEERHRQEREERKEREKLESFPIWQLETIREDGKECYRIYRAIDPSLPNWEGNRLYMPGTWDDAGIASNIAAEKTAMEESHRISEMQTMFDVRRKECE